MSELVFSERLGRHVRSASAEALGVSTSRLALDALAAGRTSDAHEYVDYVVEETERIYGIFALWLPEMLAYGSEHVPGFAAHERRLADALGCEALLQVEATLDAGLLDACHAAVDAGDAVGLERQLATVREQLRVVHDAQADWCWALLTLLRDQLGEERMDEILRVTEEGWVAPRYAALAEMTPREIFELTIEGMRGHLGGTDRTGEVRVREDDEKYVLEFDPCGTGGRMRRGDPTRGQAPAAERPELFGTTEGAHDWSWQRKDVCIYCAHCAVVNEILPIEHLGAPMRVTDYPQRPEDPCRWTIYKAREAVPDEAYRRVGKAPPVHAPRSA
jgi:hypothetical protein